MKSTKCHLFRSSVPFLGHIVGRRGLECDPAKIVDVKSWPVPDCLKSVRQFLGFVGYYRRFIPNFADIHCDAFGDLDWTRRSISVGCGLFDRLQCSTAFSVTYTCPDPRFPD